MTASKPHKERVGFVRDMWLAAAAIGNARGRGNGDASAEWAEFDEALNALEEQHEKVCDILRSFLHDADNGDRPGEGLRRMAREALDG